MTFTETTTFYVIECCRCSIPFAITNEMDDRRRKNHKTFYCPNGHPQGYYGENREERLQRENKNLRAQKTHLTEQLDSTKKSRNAYMGHLNRTKKRIVNGVCPCCNRTFKDVARHMANKHPAYAAELDDQEGK